jgi:hypothetical protein
MYKPILSILIARLFLFINKVGNVGQINSEKTDLLFSLKFEQGAQLIKPKDIAVRLAKILTHSCNGQLCCWGGRSMG